MAQDTFETHFSINNIPFGIASSESHPNRAVVTRLDDTVIFLDEVAGSGYFADAAVEEAFSQVGTILAPRSFASVMSHPVNIDDPTSKLSTSSPRCPR